MGFVKSLIVFRHGHYPHNTMIDEEGAEVLAEWEKIKQQSPAVREKFKQEVIARFMTAYGADHDLTAGISGEGAHQAVKVKRFLGEQRHKVAVCLTSPYLRPQQTAGIIFEDSSVRIKPVPELRERNLGIFTHIPRPVFHALFPDLAAAKGEFPFSWRPLQMINGQLVPLRESHADRLPAVQSVLQRADELKPGKTVAISTHADTMAEFRMLPRLLALNSDELVKRPISPVLQNPLWIQNCAVDFYEERGSDTGWMTHFRSVVLSGESPYDTGWLEIDRRHLK